ncbi:MAG: hypothetical protein ACRC4N_05845 [Gammaproteobacteria bacterium]
MDKLRRGHAVIDLETMHPTAGVSTCVTRSQSVLFGIKSRIDA